MSHNEPEVEKGTVEERPDTDYCSTCKLFVGPKECGTTLAHVREFAAATCAWPCLFPKKTARPTQEEVTAVARVFPPAYPEFIKLDFTVSPDDDVPS